MLLNYVFLITHGKSYNWKLLLVQEPRILYGMHIGVRFIIVVP